MWKRLSSSLRHRIVFLLCGNALLLGVILACLTADEDIPDGDALPRLGTVLTDSGPNVAPIVLAGLGLTGIIFAGAIDISVGSVIVVAGTVLGILFERGAGPGVCFAGCVAAAWACSNLNGLVVRSLKIPAIIVTLAGLTFYRGVALILADVFIEDFGGSIALHADAYHAPGRDHAGLILLAAVVGALLWESFGKTPRTWLAHGCSRQACRIHGLHPGRVLQSAFFIGGLFLGLAALVYVTNRQTIEPARMALGFELEVIGAIVLGGTNIFGGEGSFAGTVLGAFFLYFIDQTLIYADVGLYFREAIRGGLIVAVIGFDCALHRRRKMLDELR